MKKQLIVLSSSGLLILLFVLGVYIYKSQQAKKYGFMARENASTFVRQYSQTLGSDDAKVYLVKFSDLPLFMMGQIILLKFSKQPKDRENIGKLWILCIKPNATGQAITIHSLNEYGDFYQERVSIYKKLEAI
jgi:hypothetical protein